MKSHKTTYAWLGIVGVVFAAVVLLWPLMRHGFFITDDGDWMIIRLSAFYQSWAEGQFPVRFLGRLNNNYGYPVANFLYPGFLYVGSLIRLFGFSYVDVVKIILSISIVGSGSLLYCTLKKKYETIPSLVGAVSFVLSPYVAFDIYKRGSVGELFAFLPASLLLFGIIGRVLWVVPIATGVLIVSHNSLALLFVGVALLYVCFHAKSWMYIKAMILGMGMATFFWLPALYEKRFIIFDSVSISQPSSYFITSLNWSLLGIGFVAALLVLVFHTSKFTMFEKTTAMIALIAAWLSLPFSAFFWKWIPTLSSFVQFPYRFLSIVSMIGAFSVSAVLSVIPKKYTVICSLVLISIVVSITIRTQQSIDYVDRVEGYYSTNEGTTTVKNEFMPRWVQVVQTTRPRQKIEVLSGDATFFSVKETAQRIEGVLDVKAESVIQINTIYYPGWGVTLNGILTPLEHTNPYGLMRFAVEKGRYKLEASFRETGFRLLTDFVSLTSGVLYIVWMYSLRFRP